MGTPQPESEEQQAADISDVAKKSNGGDTTPPMESSEKSAGSSDAEKKSADPTPSISTNQKSLKKRPNSKKSGSSSKSKKGSSSVSEGGIDAHPYARSSVIEVWHGGVAGEEGSDDSSDDSDDEEEGGEKAEETPRTVRLCDIIDRAGSEGKWRYYVHYREFNRRMDEWITMDRIASPPSVGNAKVRALKKQKEEAIKQAAREKLALEEAAAAAAALAEPTRASRRRSAITSTPTNSSSMLTPDPSNNPTGTLTISTTYAGTTTPSAQSLTPTGADPGTPRSRGARSLRRTTSTVGIEGKAGDDSAAEDEGGTSTQPQRLTRRQKRKRGDEVDGATSPAMGADGVLSPSGGAAGGAPSSTTIQVGSVAVPVPHHGAVEHVVGDHVVATIPAQELDEHEGLDEASLREHEEVTKVKNVQELELGQYRMETWYFSPIPKELLTDGLVEVLYVCEFTLQFFARKEELLRFQAKELPKKQRHPPGNEIYRKGNLSMFEVDGFEARLYCQNLCYIAKLFLDHKTLYFDVDPFLFYVLCEVDNRGFHPVGYYSKEKYSDVGYNLACILTFPSHQRKGYGRFLIAFSYELSKKEEKVGSPEKPMSDLGQQAYKPYWTSTIVDFLIQHADCNTMSIMDISKQTSIMAEDIIFTLNQLGILKFINGIYFVAADKSLLDTLAKKHPVKEPRVDPTCLHWTPFLTDIKRDKFSIHSKKPSVEGEESRGNGGF